MTTKETVEAYKTLESAKLTKMEDKDKFLLIRAMRQLKPVATQYEEFVKDAQEKLKDDRFDAIQRQARQWQEEGESTTLTLDERRAVNLYLADYTRKVNECVAEELAKEQAFTYQRLSEEAFGKLIASNDWEMAVIMKIQEAIMEGGDL